tara:strand:+ start:8021 stop:8554 length:534 start_codon:yes stop_codon:yes gene_type:complete
MRPFWLPSIKFDWRIGDHSFLIEKQPFLQESINTLYLLSFLLTTACDLSRTVCSSVPSLDCRFQCHDQHGIGGFELPKSGDEDDAARLPIVLKINRVRRQEEWCRGHLSGSMAMADVTLSATPKGNGFQATVTYSSGVSISSAEAFPTKAEAISAAAMKVLDMPDRLEIFDASDAED